MRTGTFSKILLFTAVAACSFSLRAAASNLTDDLQTPFAPMTNPFGQSQTVALAPATADAIKAELLQCAFVPVKQGAVKIVQNAVLADACKPAMVPSYGVDAHGALTITNSLVIRAGAQTFRVVSWDGSDSDGGDEQALGIYDLQGNRIAVYPGLFSEGNVIDGLAHAVDAQLSEIQQ